MLVYTSKTSPRLAYTADFIGNEIFGHPILLTSSIREFSVYEGPKINYSQAVITEDEFFFAPHSLLFENEIRNQAIDLFDFNGNKCFFKTEGDHPFDIFAAIFYLLSRYEEYLPFEKDIYGRYDHKNSLASREGFLHIPLVNFWIRDFKTNLLKKFPSLQFKSQQFRFLPTYDIDEAWSYHHKGILRTFGASIKDLLGGNLKNIISRTKTILGNTTDPFYSFDWLDQLHDQYQMKPVYFFLVANKNGKYDKHILPIHASMKELIVRHANKYKTGIHPSWQSSEEPGGMATEKIILEKIIDRPVSSSRQHFLRFTLPLTFQQLAAAGITEDYSMGYGTINGFRASVASSFFWYDLEKETKTGLQLFPFCFMEANSYYEQKMNTTAALAEIQKFYAVVKEVDGLFISIWHNTFLGNAFPGWREVYEEFIRSIQE